jgi:group I intron endonuclease
MAIGTIYLIINKVNGHKYVGQTTQTVNNRWKQHIDESRRMSPYPLHRAMRKHGNHNFMIRELEECDVNKLDEREQYFIKEYNTFESAEGYNATSGGNRPILSQETKDKLSDIKSKQINTEEHNDNISSSMKESLSNNKWGFHLEENRGNGKHFRAQLMSVNIETGEERIWESASEAAIELTDNRKKCGNIIRAADNGYKAYGYLWKRLEPSKRHTSVYGIHKINWLRTPTYKSISEAVRIHGGDRSDSGLRKSLNNPRKYSWKGFYWYKE